MDGTKARNEGRDGFAPAELTSKEFDILRTLANNPDRVFSREELIVQVWGVKHATQMPVRIVDQHVARLREKLGPAGPRLITARTAGYAFGKD